MTNQTPVFYRIVLKIPDKKTIFAGMYTKIDKNAIVCVQSFLFTVNHCRIRFCLQAGKAACFSASFLSVFLSLVLLLPFVLLHMIKEVVVINNTDNMNQIDFFILYLLQLLLSPPVYAIHTAVHTSIGLLLCRLNIHPNGLHIPDIPVRRFLLADGRNRN